jgi:hypothetical protein
MTGTELIGYTGSVLIAISMMLTNIWRLRWINLIGGVFFTTYGVLLKSPPVALLNGFIVGINVYQLFRLTRQPDYFTTVELHPQSALRDKFLAFYRADIDRYYPGFRWEHLHQPHAYFVLRNLMPVKLLAYEVAPEGIINIRLDYVIPSYRDLKNAGYLFTALRDTWRRQGGATLVTRSTLPSHQRYLRAVGFVADEKDPTFFRRPV